MLDPALTYVSLDTETFPIGLGSVIPKLVCTSMAQMDVVDKPFITNLIGNGDEALLETLEWLLTDEEIALVFHYAAFDLTVIAKAFPHLYPIIFTALEQSRIYDTCIREKLLNLSTTGDLKFANAPDGSKRPLDYKLTTLETKYLGIERQDQKAGDDIWRMHFAELDGLSASDYPKDAATYAIADATGTLGVFFAQEERAFGESGPGSMKTQELHVGADFALTLMSGWGIMTDPKAKAKVEAMLARELTPDHLNLLVSEGILRPGKPPAPFKNGAIDPATGKPKMTKGTKASINTKALQARVLMVLEANEFPVETTDSGAIKTSADVIMDVAGLDPTLRQYQHRAKLQKLVTTELPRMGDGGSVHPMFDVLKETGRTSSFASKLHPSMNIQNVDLRIRGVYVPRRNKVLLSCDYSSLELGTLAQKLYTLFGQSRLRDLINEGKDAHSYLGAALAYNLHEEFREACGLEEVETEDDIYKVFMVCKTSLDPKVREFYKHWRTFAKPTGLGFPGGLGPKTFVEYAKATFGVVVTVETAHQLRNIWHATYPEMKNYFDWINDNCEDPNFPEAYAYVSPLGMYRANASYCAAANGAALQTPAAEGGKLATFEVIRACYDHTMNSCLYGCHGLGFIHDELLMEIPHDKFMHERACEVERVMVEAMSAIVTDVQVKAEPALMLRWDKRADQVFDENGRLTIWTPDA